MPKAKPTQIVVHRIELQETERAALEAALAGNFVTNAVSAAGSVLSGFGQALAPFSGVLTAIGAAYIAEKSISQIVDDAKIVVEEAVPMLNPVNQANAYIYLVNYLKANPEWNKLGGKLAKLESDLNAMKASPILIGKFKQWMKIVSSTRNRTGTWPTQSPDKSFTSFYSAIDFARDQLGP